jgi:hypothetical protein
MEDTTLFLAQAFGFYLTVGGLATLIYFRELQEAVEEFAMSKMLYYLTGQFLFVLGLVFALAHTTFTGIVPMLVTVLGYFPLVFGGMILLLPHSWVGALMHFVNRPWCYIVKAICMIALGGALLFIVYALPLIA